MEKQSFIYADDKIHLLKEVRVVCRESGNYGLHFHNYETGEDYVRFYKTERGMKMAWARFMNN